MRFVLLPVALILILLVAALHGQTPSSSPAAPTAQQLAQMRERLQDWPNLTRYREENARLQAPRPGEQRVVFLGDSITDSWGRNAGVFFPGKPYVNRGISGQTTPQMLVRFQQDVLRLQPGVVVILAGINDIAGNTGPESPQVIEDNFRSMVAIAKASHVRVVLSSILPASYLPWQPELKPAEEVKEINAWLEQFSQAEHVTYLNYYPALVDAHGGMRPELAGDKFVHPNAEGYAVMAPLAEKAIAQALLAPAP